MNLVLEDVEGNAVTVLDLRESVAGVDTIGMGEIFPVYVANRGDSNVRMITIEFAGEGSDRAQIAMNSGDAPIWAEPGMPLIFEGTLEPNKRFGILARGIYDPVDAEGRYQFDLLLRGTAF